MDNINKIEYDNSMRERIIAAAIECIEKTGLPGLTVRRIAKEAHVNVAAVNYYFGSKDRLVEEVIRKTLYTAFDENIDDFLRDSNESPARAVEMFLNHFISGALKYPNLVKIHFYEAFVNNNYRTASAKGMSSFVSEFEKIMYPVILKKSKRKFKIDMVQFWSAVFFPMIFPGQFRDYTGINMKDPAWLKDYIARLLELYFR